MQKTYCVDFLTKKIVKNMGQVQQYYVEDSHPAIIEPDEFDTIQLEIDRRKRLGRPTSTTSIFASRLVCADCGGSFGKKVWGSYKSDKTYRKEVWRCNDKYKRLGKPGNGCQTPHITDDEIKARFLAAFNKLISNRNGLIEDCRLAQSVLCDTTAIDAELVELHRELEIVTALSRKAVLENARTAVNQTEWIVTMPTLSATTEPQNARLNWKPPSGSGSAKQNSSKSSLRTSRTDRLSSTSLTKSCGWRSSTPPQ